MATSIGIGFSRDSDGLKAAKQAAAQAKLNLRQDKIDMAIVLCTSHYQPQQFLPSLFNDLQQTKLIGSSTAAIILGNRIEHQGVAVLALYSEEIRFETSCADHLNLKDLATAGRELANNCLTEYGKQQRKFFLMFADGLLQNLSQCFAGLNESFNNVIPVIGACGSDDFRFQKTFQFFNDTVLSSGACGALWGGRLHYGASCRHGWRPLGKPRFIDEVDGNVIKSIGQRPAARIYQEYFENEFETIKASSLSHLNIRYPLGTPVAPKQEYLVRNVIKTLEDDSIVFQDSVPPGKEIHVMIGNKESCLDAAEAAAEDVLAQLEHRAPKLIFLFESMARYRILGRAAGHEIQRIREILGHTVPMLGMYSFGEIFTFQTGQGAQTLLQNESVTVLGII